MKFNKYLSIFLTSIPALLTNAEMVKFKVLAIRGTPILNIDGQQHPMIPNEYPLYSADVNINTFPVNYNYIVQYNETTGESEQFTRQRQQGEEPLNEFFNREKTIVKHPELPRAYEPFPYFEQSKIYDDNFVATIVVKCDPAKLNQLYSDTDTKEKIPAEVVYASPYTVKTFKETNFSLSGQSTREVPKLSYKIGNLKNGKKELYGRTSIKLRAEHMDYSYLRDKIYSDLANSLGVPTAQNTFARLFINGRDIGLFDLSDDITNNRYLRETFNKGEKYTTGEENPIYKVDCDGSRGNYGDLGYYGDDVNNKMYSIYNYRGNDTLIDKKQHFGKDVLPLLKEIDNYKKGLAERFNLDSETFLKSMVLEFLGGAVDNYWNRPGNYYLYKDNAKNMWYFHDADFHYTFGVNSKEDLMLNTPLAQYPPMIVETIKRDRAPLDALRSHPENEQKFKSFIDRILRTSFHTKALFPRIDSLASLIRDDAQWDISIKQKENPNPTAEKNIAENIDIFDNETKSEEKAGARGGITLKYFIKTKIALVSNELQITVPSEYENDLGIVEVPDQKKSAKFLSGSTNNKMNLWNMSLMIFLLFITLLY